MKKLCTVAVCLLMLFAAALNATAKENPIFLHINGLYTQPDTPPVIVNDRVMVPLRFIAERFCLEVEWDSSNRAVHVNTKRNKLAIVGSEQFKLAMDASLNLLKDYDYNTYCLINNTISVIMDSDSFLQSGRSISLPNNAYTAFYTELKEIVVSNHVLEELSQQMSSVELAYYYAGTLTHELTHGILGPPGNSLLDVNDREVTCELAALRTLQKISAPRWIITEYKQRVVHALTL